jgi:hypothetical protein
MSSGRKLWADADEFAASFGPNTACRQHFLALKRMAEEAECAAQARSQQECIAHLRELQAHCERLIGVLAPNQRGRPKLVRAA